MNSISARLRTNCPICGGTDLYRSVSFKSLPVFCNVLYADVASARTAETGEFFAAYCRSCTHLFNAAFDETRVGYSQSYENSLHFSPRFVEFAEALAKRLSDRYALKNKVVIDIGCGKGDFLVRLCEISGAQGFGFDKSFQKDRGPTAANVHFFNDWFDEGYAHLQADFISCRHVIEHILEPILFLQTLRAHPGLRRGTTFYFEVPNALYTLRDLGIWDLIYEHVSYFTPRSLRAACEASGFTVLHEGTSFGEQYLYVEAVPGDVIAPSCTASATVNALVERFDRAYRDKVNYWQSFLSTRDPRRLAAWGAGSKGVTFVNVVRGAAELSALVDVSPYKQGRFAPSTGTPVIAPGRLRDLSVQALIVMNPLYRDEIEGIARSMGLFPEIVVA